MAIGTAASAQSIQSITFANDILKPGETAGSTVTLSQPAPTNTSVEFTTRPLSAQNSIVTVPLNRVVTAGNASRSFRVLVPQNSPGGCVKVAGTLPASPQQGAHVSHQEIIVDPAPASSAVILGSLRPAGATQIPSSGTSDSMSNARRFMAYYVSPIEISGTIELAQTYPHPVRISFTSTPARTWTSANQIVIAPGGTRVRFTIRTNFQAGADEMDQWPGVCTTLQVNATVTPELTKPPSPQPAGSGPTLQPYGLPPARATVTLTWLGIDG
ncbi:hypothetical protein [Ectothiorhodospira lacustris]|uniref:hypothetical protein n=1 Tax=Ectothiorhodospira lacustris TaxID=2899127 RepID=UPI001EE972B9|nr:hypothetical protein [Ectothiorhodospira lacustris]MCG5511475.1 hypothetical protein [Ectothiorhodospira lacustris]MCG5523262.1 hypothetical protein [Ectothiorhodospira lacustris]